MSAFPANPPQELPAKSAALLELRNVAKRFAAVDVLKNISLNIASGEFLTLLGESGSGKTTVLRLIAGFEQPSSGEIWMSGERLDLLPPYKRRVNTVFQNYALFPHLSACDNVAYGLRVKNTPTSEIAARVEEALRMVKMQGFAASRPARLSGGQQRTGNKTEECQTTAAGREHETWLRKEGSRPRTGAIITSRHLPPMAEPAAAPEIGQIAQGG